LLFQGRVHGYEGYDAACTALPAFIAAALGARVLVLTNAAGGLDPSFIAGDLMLITDVLVLTGARSMGLELQRGIPSLHPLPRPLFHPDVLDLARRAASESHVRLREGVYGFCSGPTYETRAEIAYYRLAGVQAVGMSTASEVFAAAQYKLPVVAVSCVTNIARTVRQAVSHDEVTAVAAQASDRLSRLVHTFLRLL
jgi:purine-nucleoside phosphorylase